MRPTAAPSRESRLALALAIAAALALVVLGALRPPWDRVWGDEGTYLAMAASLAGDGDLVFDVDDLDRLEAAPPGGRQMVILQRAPGARITYSKSVLYPLAAAPFYAVAGEAGPVLLNALALALALALAGVFLGRLARAAGAPPGRAALTLVTFAATGVLVPYATWRMSDSFQASLALAGLVLVFAPLRPGSEETRAAAGARGRVGEWLERLLDARVAPWAGAALLGLVAAMRYPNALLPAAAVAATLVAGRGRIRRRLLRAAGLAAAAALAFLAVQAANEALVGTASPYRSVRTGFDAVSGYPAGPGGDVAARRFEVSGATNVLGLAPRLQPLVAAYSGLYFFVGRHSGALVYYPAAVVFALLVLWRQRRRFDPAGLVALAAAAGVAVFYVVWVPRNYFGGETFLGNRYVLAAYPALLVALARPPGRRALAVAWTIALAVYGSALAGVVSVRGLDSTSQSHTRAGIFRWLPYESTAVNIEGRRDRYWVDEHLRMVRFVDPFAEVGEYGFRIASDRPAAELMAAVRGRPSGPLHLLVDLHAPAAELEVSTWRGRHRHALRGPTTTLVPVELPSAWRHHSFHWQPDEAIDGHLLRLGLTAPEGAEEPAVADVRVLGYRQVEPPMFDLRLLRFDVPARARAGSVSRLPLALVNTSDALWPDVGVVPVRLAYRLFPLDGDQAAREGARTRLPRPVAPGERVRLPLVVRWPAAPGRYLLEVDLVLEGITWFGARRGEPLAEATVEVVGAAESATGVPPAAGR